MQEISNAGQKDLVAKFQVSNEPLLVVLCGPSHSGKSTFARRLAASGKRFTVVSSDRVRSKLAVAFGNPESESRVWKTFESMKCRALKQRRNVVLDACHISPQARWHAVQGPNTGYCKVCVIFDLPWQIIRDRCCEAGRMPLEEVRRMWQVFQDSKPGREELSSRGFDEVLTVQQSLEPGSAYG